MGDFTYTLDYDFLLAAGSTIAQATGIGPDLTYTGNGGTSLIWDENGVLVSTTNNQPRYDHDPVTGAALGLLIEEARTNLLIRSEEFENAAWTKNGTTVTADQATAPDGGNTADLLEAADGANDSAFQVVSGVDADSKYTLSVWIALAPGSDTPAADSNVQVVLFGDLVATVVNNIGSDLTFSLQRFSVTATTDGAPTNFTAQVGKVEGGDAGVNLIVWGAQVEKGAFPTSYIKTTTGTVTRSADVLSTTDLGWFNDGGPGTFYVRGSQPAAAANTHLFAISDGTADNRILILENGANKTQHFLSTGGVVQVSLSDLVNWADGTEKKAALAFAANDAAAYTDGTQTGTDGSVTLPTGLTTLWVGANQTGVAQWNGHIAKIKYWDVRKSNAFLQALTA